MQLHRQSPHTLIITVMLYGTAFLVGCKGKTSRRESKQDSKGSHIGVITRFRGVRHLMARCVWCFRFLWFFGRRRFRHFLDCDRLPFVCDVLMFCDFYRFVGIGDVVEFLKGNKLLATQL